MLLPRRAYSFFLYKKFRLDASLCSFPTVAKFAVVRLAHGHCHTDRSHPHLANVKAILAFSVQLTVNTLVLVLRRGKSTTYLVPSTPLEGTTADHVFTISHPSQRSPLLRR